jgi:hypothetical protein
MNNAVQSSLLHSIGVESVVSIKENKIVNTGNLDMYGILYFVQCRSANNGLLTLSGKSLKKSYWHRKSYEDQYLKKLLSNQKIKADVHTILFIRKNQGLRMASSPSKSPASDFTSINLSSTTSESNYDVDTSANTSSEESMQISPIKDVINAAIRSMDPRSSDAKSAKCLNDNCYCVRLSVNHLVKNPGLSNEYYIANTVLYCEIKSTLIV